MEIECRRNTCKRLESPPSKGDTQLYQVATKIEQLVTVINLSLGLTMQVAWILSEKEPRSENE